jgi:hypothetical protein
MSLRMLRTEYVNSNSASSFVAPAGAIVYDPTSNSLFFGVAGTTAKEISATSSVAYATTTASSGNITQTLRPGGARAAAGLYRLSVYLEITTAAGAGTYEIKGLYTDDAKAEQVELVSAGASLTAVGSSQSSAVIYSNGTADVSYTVLVTGITGTPVYVAKAVLERLA